jgi:hypothetical protein
VEQHVTQILTEIVTVMLGLWLLSLARKPPTIDTATGCLILRHSWLFRGVGVWTGMALPALAIGLIVAIPVPNLGQLCVILLFLAFALGGIGLLVETLTDRVIVNADGIAARSPWRGWRTLLWEEVVEVSYSHMNKWFVLAGPKRQKIRVSIYLVGIRSFLAILQEKVERKRYVKAEKGFAELGLSAPSPHK